MAEATEVVEQPQPEAEAPSFKQFSDDRKAGKVDATAGGDEHSPGGDQFDAEQNKFVNKAPRDSSGRFAKVRENLERAQKRSTFVHAVLEGAVEPDEHTMDADTWAAARSAQIARGSNKITPPEFPADKPADSVSAEPKNAEQELTPEETEHFKNYESMMADVAAKVAVDPETRTALDGVRTAVDKFGVSREAINFLGHILADTANGNDVLNVLGKSPEVIAMYSRLPPQGMQAALHALSRQLAAQKATAQVTPAKPKPAPPAPVGGRATSTAFDVNDESSDPDEWARSRNEQLSKRGDAEERN